MAERQRANAYSGFLSGEEIEGCQHHILKGSGLTILDMGSVVFYWIQFPPDVRYFFNITSQCPQSQR
jgi:hypothetical protein